MMMKNISRPKFLKATFICYYLLAIVFTTLTKFKPVTATHQRSLASPRWASEPEDEADYSAKLSDRSMFDNAYRDDDQSTTSSHHNRKSHQRKSHHRLHPRRHSRARWQDSRSDLIRSLHDKESFIRTVLGSEHGGRAEPAADRESNKPLQSRPRLHQLWPDFGGGSSSSWPTTPVTSKTRSSMNKKNNGQQHRQRGSGSGGGGKHHRNRTPSSSKRPNIVFLLTDDQDIELGSMQFMPKTLRLLAEEGAHFPHAYVTTPMCCPSRSSILTGLYTHNHNVYTNNDNCSNAQWQAEFEPRTFASYLSNSGYRTAFFGKYLNEYNGSYIPPGWREWSALVRNSRFYNYTLNVNGRKMKHLDNYHLDYYPDLIVNESLSFLRSSKSFFPQKPVMMVMSFPSPHGPEDAAPQFQHLFENVTTHRTPSWDYAPNLDKQWLLRRTGRMEQIHVDFTDMLHRKRLQTLQSIDDAVERLYEQLLALGELDNTYIVYTSDHGYHLGQFGLVKGKSMPFEFDVRVPFYVRGPGVPAGVRIPDIVLNIDIAPTFMDMAGLVPPEDIDGVSFLPLLKAADAWASSQAKQEVAGGNTRSSEKVSRTTTAMNHQDVEVPRKRLWRDSFLIERGKWLNGLGSGGIGDDSDGGSSNASKRRKMSKRQWLAQECLKAHYRSPCGESQKWECFKEDGPSGEMRIRKCRRPKGELGLPPFGKSDQDQEHRRPKSTGGHHRRQRPEANFASEQECVCPPADDDEKGREMTRDSAGHQLMPPLLTPVYQEFKQLPNGLIGDQEAEGRFLDSIERRLQRQFLRDHVSNSGFRPIFIKKRAKRHTGSEETLEKPVEDEEVVEEEEEDEDEADVVSSRASATLADDADDTESVQDTFDVDGVYQLNRLLDETLARERKSLNGANFNYTDAAAASDANGKEDDAEKDTDYYYNAGQKKNAQFAGCLWGGRRGNGSTCPDNAVSGVDSGGPLGRSNWRRKKDRLDNLIRKLQSKLLELKGIRKQLRGSRPSSSVGDISVAEKGCDCSLGGAGGRPSLERGHEGDQSWPVSSEDHHSMFRDAWRRKKTNKDKRPAFDSSFERFERKREKKLRRKTKFENTTCNLEKMNCFTHDDSHWKTAPLWTKGPFCFCQNANNNTFFCSRTINETHNYLYCEFVTGFITFYDLRTDPHQLRNVVYELDFGTLGALSRQLGRLKECRGWRQCGLEEATAVDMDIGNGDEKDPTDSEPDDIANGRKKDIKESDGLVAEA